MPTRKPNVPLSSLSLLVGIFAVFLLALPAAATLTYTTVALTGDIDPGTGNPIDFFVRPLVNDAGDVLVTGGVNSDTALWVASGGTLVPVMRGETTDLDTGLEFGQSWGNARINGSGEATAVHIVSDPMDSYGSIWLGPPGDYDLRAIEDDDPGSILSISQANRFAVFDDGSVAFRAVTRTTFPYPNSLYFASASTSPAIVLQEGLTAPGTSASFTDISVPLGNATGGVIISGELDAPSSADAGVWYATSTGASLLLREGDPVPGGGGELVAFSPAIRGLADTGEALVSFSGDGGTRGYVTGTPGNLSVAVVEGDPAPVPGEPDATFLQLQAESMAGNGDFVFRGALSGMNMNFSNNRAIFHVEGDTLSMVARLDDEAPGTAGEHFDRLDAPIVNDQGQVAFSGEDSDNEEGIWALHDDGLELVVRTGDLFDLGGGDLREVSAFWIELDDARWQERALGDSGDLAFLLYFTDGSSGVFTAQLAPEPSSTLMLAIGAAACCSLSRRRRPSQQQAKASA